MRPEHTRALMGLPTTFKLSGVQRIDQRVLGVRLLVNQTKTDTLPLYLESTERCLDPHAPPLLQNGLCYGLARAICLAAQGLEITPLFPTAALESNAAPAPRPTVAHKRSRDLDNDTEHTHCTCNELEARVIRLEHRLLAMRKQLRRS